MLPEKFYYATEEQNVSHQNTFSGTCHLNCKGEPRKAFSQILTPLLLFKEKGPVNL